MSSLLVVAPIFLNLTRNPRPNSVIYLPVAPWFQILGTMKRRSVFLSHTSQPSGAPDTLTEHSRQPFLCQNQHISANTLEVRRRKVAVGLRPGDTLHCS